MDSQTFIAICFFFLLASFSLFAYASFILLTAKNEVGVEKSKRMLHAATTLMILTLIAVGGEMMNPTNPLSVYTADEIIKR